MTYPICLIVGILIRLDSKGPAFYVQERLGYQGRNFRCIKFRTMRVEGEEVLARYLESHPQAGEEWRKYAKLRAVLKGEMSLIGPRPYLPHELGRIGLDVHTILAARPGMTGFWQVSGRNELSLEDRVKLESWYVRSWTPWLDCIIFAKTFRVVLFPENGFRCRQQLCALGGLNSRCGLPGVRRGAKQEYASHGERLNTTLQLLGDRFLLILPA